MTYINRKLSSHPHQLCRIKLQFANSAGMRLESIDGIVTKLVNEFQITGETVGMLVVLGRNVRLDRMREAEVMSATERHLEDIGGLHLVGWRVPVGCSSGAV